MRIFLALLLLQPISPGSKKPSEYPPTFSPMPAPVEVQTRAVYEVFLESVRLREAMPSSLIYGAAQPESPLESLRKSFRLETDAWQLVRQTAGWLHAVLEENHRRGRSVLENLALPAAQKQQEMDRLWAQRQKAIDEAVESLRIAVGTARFAEFDQRVRAMVMPGLRLRYVAAPPWTGAGKRK
ncbi:MAG: hypothetical protein ACOYU7_04660 [Bacillota bacterium]